MSKQATAAVVKTIRIDWGSLPSAAAVAVHPPKFPAFEGEPDPEPPRAEAAGEQRAREP